MRTLRYAPLALVLPALAWAEGDTFTPPANPDTPTLGEALGMFGVGLAVALAVVGGIEGFALSFEGAAATLALAAGAGAAGGVAAVSMALAIAIVGLVATGIVAYVALPALLANLEQQATAFGQGRGLDVSAGPGTPGDGTGTNPPGGMPVPDLGFQGVLGLDLSTPASGPSPDAGISGNDGISDGGDVGVFHRGGWLPWGAYVVAADLAAAHADRLEQFGGTWIEGDDDVLIALGGDRILLAPGEFVVNPANAHAAASWLAAVTQEEAVPLPASLLLLLAGVLPIMLRRRAA